MKPDTERKKHYKAKLHKKRNNLHVHLSKELRIKLKEKKRSILVRRDDRVKVLRGPGKGKEGKVTKVDISKRKVYVEGVTIKNAKAKETLIPLQPSNLMLMALESTKERKKKFSEEAFKKPEKKKPEKPKTEVKKETGKPEAKKEEAKEETVKPPVPKPESAPKVPAAPVSKG